MMDAVLERAKRLKPRTKFNHSGRQGGEEGIDGDKIV